MEPFDPIENDLRQALERKDAPEWFAAGVMARVKAEGVKPRRVWFAGWGHPAGWMRWAAAVATLAVVFGGVRWEQVRRERVQGEQAKAKLMLALRMTGEKLRMAQVRVQALEHEESAQ
ncbi:hypothetical protein [uncultured Paludibaculum sp.]|uniref:hypothetical protein n=1 Tax=uncultured Paludibaculum sp. TaxID=1765020 RepID=UPI002AAB6171|nr:hypothetical protein [uncultured Paludibaculum sp.]